MAYIGENESSVDGQYSCVDGYAEGDEGGEDGVGEEDVLYFDVVEVDFFEGKFFWLFYDGFLFLVRVGRTGTGCL